VFTLGNAACGVAGVLMAMRFLASRDAGDLLLAAAFAPAALRLRRARRPDRALAAHVVGARPRARFARRRHLVRRRARRRSRTPPGMNGLWDAVILVYFVCCGVSRLARYNVTAEAMSATRGKVTTSKARRSRRACSYCRDRLGRLARPHRREPVRAP
jgi:CDP-diacylglycerol--serine O-phosphatidyltransferase